MGELMPCPFCGGVPFLTDAVGEQWVSCGGCRASTEMRSTTEAAIAAWNRRTPSAPAVPNDEPTYPCADCGTMRTKAQGGTVFTVCDTCWERHYHPERAPAVPATTGSLWTTPAAPGSVAIKVDPSVTADQVRAAVAAVQPRAAAFSGAPAVPERRPADIVSWATVDKLGSALGGLLLASDGISEACRCPGGCPGCREWGPRFQRAIENARGVLKSMEVPAPDRAPPREAAPAKRAPSRSGCICPFPRLSCPGCEHECDACAIANGDCAAPGGKPGEETK